LDLFLPCVIHLCIEKSKWSMVKWSKDELQKKAPKSRVTSHLTNSLGRKDVTGSWNNCYIFYSYDESFYLLHQTFQLLWTHTHSGALPTKPDFPYPTSKLLLYHCTTHATYISRMINDICTIILRQFFETFFSHTQYYILNLSIVFDQ